MMKKNIGIAFIAAFLFTSGCVESQEEIAARNAEKAKEQIEINKQNYCAKLGAPPGSDQYAACRQWIEQQLAKEQDQERAAEAKVDPSTQGIQQEVTTQNGGTSTSAPAARRRGGR